MGFRYNPSIPKEGLVIALDASNPKSYSGSGTTWADLSGNGNDFTWDGTGGVSFTSDGSKSYFNPSGTRATGPASNSLGIDNSSGYTIFMISATTTDNAQSAFKFYNSNGHAIADSTSRGIFVHPGWTNYTIYFDQGGCCAASQRTLYTIGNPTIDNLNLFCFHSNVTNRAIWMNGNKLITNTTSAANIDLGSDAIHLGGSNNYGGAASAWGGKLALFYVYNRPCSDDEILETYHALRGRFGL